MLLGPTLVLVAIASYGSCYGSNSEENYLTPDKIMLGNIGLEIWHRREDVISEAAQEFDFLEKEALADLQDLEDDAGDEEVALDCSVCVAFVRGLQAFINQGLEFEDIRDFAVDVCKNVTIDLNYDGEIICDGIIDVFGPHVYYVIGATNMTAREVCQFHQSCPESASRRFDPNAYPVKDKLVIPMKPYHSRGSKKQVIKIAHITDVHLDENYAPGSPDTCQLPICCRDYWPGSGSAGPWGSYGCALPLNTLDLVLEFLSNLGVDMVVNTGDTPNHALWEETQEGQIWQSEILVNAIKEHLPGVPVHLCVGNHDTYPTNLFYGPSPLVKDLLHQLRLMHQDVANFTDEQIATFEEAGNYVTEIQPGLKLLSYNTNYGYRDNFYGVLLQDSPDWPNTVNFMEEEFNIARANGEKIIMLGHHSMSGGFRFWEEFINDIMMRNGDLTIMHLMGHSHNDFYKMALDSEGNAVHVNQATGSLMTTRNPTFKVFYLDTDTFIPTHFENYFINISKTLDGETPAEIELMYSSNVDYEMPDLSAASYQDFTDRMEQDDDLLWQFRWNEDSRYSDPGSCDEGCKKSFLCSRRTTSSDTYNDCMNS